MKIIKLAFWISVSVILAYFMTDIKIGGRTIKQQIDHYLRFDGGMTLREKVNQWLGGRLGPTPSAEPAKEPAAATSGMVPKREPADEIGEKDVKRLERVIEKNQ